MALKEGTMIIFASFVAGAILTWMVIEISLDSDKMEYPDETDD